MTVTIHLLSHSLFLKHSLPLPSALLFAFPFPRLLPACLPAAGGAVVTLTGLEWSAGVQECHAGGLGDLLTGRGDARVVVPTLGVGGDHPTCCRTGA